MYKQIPKELGLLQVRNKYLCSKSCTFYRHTLRVHQTDQFITYTAITLQVLLPLSKAACTTLPNPPRKPQ
ncbi:hypothetical protein XELAEV_18014145mg [Xenopus laevis]|uniref:Uncharacterized protein n=1 Tax=Xenopus laevis TaxID=8355 RepID=A0A974DGR1_XENLA|nr:hypothetical protein XELAEV_18014145mg [Xenopus laevis]